MSNYLSNINSPADLKQIPKKHLPAVAKEIRQLIIKTIGHNGGHLASNLGVVELSIALHTVLDAPKDKIIWDVGHQCYAHKILTGRKDAFADIRMTDGISGFCNKTESLYDCFTTGHSSNSISLALGMAQARDLNHGTENIVAVIGDGALTGGVAYEALNNAGDSHSPFVVILNDNGMSIGGNVGGMARHLSNLRAGEFYNSLKYNTEKFLSHIPVIGNALVRFVSRIKRSLKTLLVPGMIFENLGLVYLGPVDGHDIESISVLLKRALKLGKPALVHIKTVKGKGYEPAENNPSLFHGMGPFDVESGKALHRSGLPSYTDVFSEALAEIMEQDKDVVAITAAMASGTGLQPLAARWPKRIFDVGIAEQHAVTLAAGLAANGKKPVAAIYSCFLQRAYDQIVDDVCLQDLPVVFAVDRAGLVGQDGVSHQGSLDLSYLRSIPNLTVMAPADGRELKEMLKLAVNLGHPVAIRYPRADAVVLPCPHTPVEFGKGALYSEGDGAAILAVGSMVSEAEKAADTLKEKDINVSVVNCRFIDPLDKELILSAAEKAAGRVITVEENVLAGGFGSACAEFLAEHGITPVIMALPNAFIAHGKREEQLHDMKLDAEGIAEIVMEHWYSER